jgi:hypothetical protein
MTPTNPTEVQMKLARECQKKAYKMAVDDVTTFRDYGVQSALLAIQATEARAQGLVDALEPFEKALGKRQLLCKDDESVTWSAITVGDLRKARQALATWRRT